MARHFIAPMSANFRHVWVNNELRSQPLEPKMTRYWKSDLILMIAYSSIAAVFVVAAL